MAESHLVAKITSRDFKRTRGGGMPLNLARFREFGLGLALGLSLSLCVLVWQNYREKNAQKVAVEVPRPEPRSDRDAAAVETAESWTAPAGRRGTSSQRVSAGPE